MPKIKFVENATVSLAGAKRINVLSEAVIKENGRKCLGAFKMPISRVDVRNANGRIYGRNLYEKVIREFRKDTFALCDHPEGASSGSIKDAAAVISNPVIEGNTVFADFYLFGPNGRLILEALEAGAQIGTSSVGYGELLEGDIVDPATYEVERFADFVLTPSQGTFGSLDGAITESTKPKAHHILSLSEQMDQIDQIDRKDEEKRQIAEHKRKVKENTEKVLRELEEARRNAHAHEQRASFTEAFCGQKEAPAGFTESSRKLKTLRSSIINEHENGPLSPARQKIHKYIEARFERYPALDTEENRARLLSYHSMQETADAWFRLVATLTPKIDKGERLL